MTQPTARTVRANRQAAARAYEEAQDRALRDDRLHVFAPCTCGIDGLLFWIDREDDRAWYWVEWWTTQPGTQLSWRERLNGAWRLLSRGTTAAHELILSTTGAERLAAWFLNAPFATSDSPTLPLIPDLLTQRDESWETAEALLGIETLIDAEVAREAHDAGFYAGAAFARRHYLTANNIVRAAGTGGTTTIAAALDLADQLERSGSTEAAATVRNVARLAAGYWEDLEEFGRLKDALADAMGLDFKCPVDVLQRATRHFRPDS